MRVDRESWQKFVELVSPVTTKQAGLELMYDYFQELSDELGEPVELDPEEIKSEFAVYDSVEDARRALGDAFEVVAEGFDGTVLVRYV